MWPISAVVLCQCHCLDARGVGAQSRVIRKQDSFASGQNLRRGESVFALEHFRHHLGRTSAGGDPLQALQVIGHQNIAVLAPTRAAEDGQTCQRDHGAAFHYNESMSVEVGEQALYLKPMGMAMFNTSTRAHAIRRWALKARRNIIGRCSSRLFSAESQPHAYLANG
jgi:hypothetical protein